MRKIEIHNKIVLVDDEDYNLLCQFNWGIRKGRNTFYAQCKMLVNGKYITVTMHSFLLKPKQGFFIDHKDRNGLNNTRDNLRICTPSENSANRRSAKNSSSKYLGVSLCGKSGKWVAVIRKHKVRYYIGSFDNEEDAAIAYNEKAFELHGEFAMINNI